jgi:hypothetical protein
MANTERYGRRARADGAGTLMTSPEQRVLLLAAVADAINYLEDDRVFCADCGNPPGTVCLEHQEAANLAARYAEIHAQLREAGTGNSELRDSRLVAAALGSGTT